MQGKPSEYNLGVTSVKGKKEGKKGGQKKLQTFSKTKIQNTDNIKCQRECGDMGTLIHLMVGVQGGAVILEDSLAVSCKAKHRLLYSSFIPILGIYLNEFKTAKTCT